MKNICSAAQSSIKPNRNFRTSRSCAGMPELGWWDELSDVCHRNNNNILQIDYNSQRILHFGRAVLRTHMFFKLSQLWLHSVVCVLKVWRCCSRANAVVILTGMWYVCCYIEIKGALTGVVLQGRCQLDASSRTRTRHSSCRVSFPASPACSVLWCSCACCYIDCSRQQLTSSAGKVVPPAPASHLHLHTKHLAARAVELPPLTLSPAPSGREER